MMHLYDRATMARAHMLDLDPQLRALLTARITALVTDDYDLTDATEFLIVDDPTVAEGELLRHIGFSPFVEPIDGIRFGRPGYYPPWDWLVRHEGWFEMSVTFGSTFAYVILIRDTPNDGELLRLCRFYALAIP